MRVTREHVARCLLQNNLVSVFRHAFRYVLLIVLHAHGVGQVCEAQLDRHFCFLHRCFRRFEKAVQLGI